MSQSSIKMKPVHASILKKRRSRGVLNYALLNRKGFQSVEVKKSKSKLKTKKAGSAPTSPQGKVKVNFKDFVTPLITNKGSIPPPESGSVASCANSSANSEIKFKGQHGKGVNPFSLVSADLASLNPLNDSLEFNDETSELQIENHNMEEKKRRLRESIAMLQHKVKEQEEDSEMQQLMKLEAQLRQKLADGSPPVEASTSSKSKSSKKRVKNGVTHKGTPKRILKNLTKQSVCENDPQADLQNLTGIKFDMEGFIKKNVDANTAELTDVLKLAEKANKKHSGTRSKKSKKRSPSPPSDSSSSESSSESDSDDSDREVQEIPPPKKRKGKLKSGLYAKSGDTKLVSSEWYAHSALDEAIVGEKEPKELSFNLLVAGELEIITSNAVSSKEQFSRMQVLKKLAYKHEFLPLPDILSQYANFLQKVEKGKFRWGSKSDLVQFEQQLMYNVSIERSRVIDNRWDKDKRKGRGFQGKDERKKYCLDYNRGTCNLQSPHEGLINGAKVSKYHICK